MQRIPIWGSYWYHSHMTTQISVRLPDELVNFLDRSVTDGTVSSRAAMVTRALERERRRLNAVADAEILATQGPQDDLDDLVEWSATNTAFED